MSFDAEKEWKTLQIAEFSKNLFLEIIKEDRKPYECIAIIHSLIHMLLIVTGCEEKAIREFDDKFPKLIDEVFVKSGVKQ